MAEDNLTTHVCDICGHKVECIGTRAEFALEREWYISPFSDFCSQCRGSEYARMVIETETALIEKRAGQLATAS